jgi:uncharacterized lipoprotein YbaY
MQPFFHFSSGVKKRMLLACLTSLALAACSHQSAPAPEPPIEVVVPVEKSTAPVEVQYAKVATLRLKDLELPPDVSTEQVQVIEGKAQDLIVKNGQIRFITPQRHRYRQHHSLARDPHRRAQHHRAHHHQQRQAHQSHS